jgi:hypothetical protein
VHAAREQKIWYSIGKADGKVQSAVPARSGNPGSVRLVIWQIRPTGHAVYLLYTLARKNDAVYFGKKKGRDARSDEQANGSGISVDKTLRMVSM